MAKVAVTDILNWKTAFLTNKIAAINTQIALSSAATGLWKSYGGIFCI